MNAWQWKMRSTRTQPATLMLGKCFVINYGLTAKHTIRTLAQSRTHLFVGVDRSAASLVHWMKEQTTRRDCNHKLIVSNDSFYGDEIKCVFPIAVPQRHARARTKTHDHFRILGNLTCLRQNHSGHWRKKNRKSCNCSISSGSSQFIYVICASTVLWIVGLSARCNCPSCECGEYERILPAVIYRNSHRSKWTK